MKNRERNKLFSTISFSGLYVLLFALITLCVKSVNAQIDTCLKSLTLSDFEHAFDLKDLETITKDFVKNHDVIPLGTLFLERNREGWAYETDSCLFDNHSARFLDSFNIGTKLIFCGLAMSPIIEARKGFRSVSYKLPDNILLNDTLKFSFITLADGIGGFQPSIYFSKKIKLKRAELNIPLLKNGRYLKYAKKMSNRSFDDLDLTESEFELIITKELRKLKWIHIVNDYYGDEGGFIVSSCYTVNQQPVDINSDSIESILARIYFNNDSYIISNEELYKLDSIIKRNNLSKSNKVLVSAFADKSGNHEENLILASNRANSIVEYLITNGLDKSDIIIEKLSIGDFGSAKKNRVCIVKIVNK